MASSSGIRVLRPTNGTPFKQSKPVAGGSRAPVLAQQSDRARAERLFEAEGNSRNAFYARISQIRAEMESSNLVHEVLGIGGDRVTLKLGGGDGRLVRLQAGDMLVLPAGLVLLCYKQNNLV